MTEMDALLARIAALEARVHYLETKTVATWPHPFPQPIGWPQPLTPISPPFLPNGPWPVTCTDGIGNVSATPPGTAYSPAIGIAG